MKKLLIIFIAFFSLVCSAQIEYNGKYNLLLYRGSRMHTTYAPTSGINPYFAIPDTGVTLMVGNNDTIFGDAFINCPIGTNLNVQYICDIGSDLGADFALAPTISDTGYHRLITNFYEGGAYIGSDTIWINVLPKAPYGVKRILTIGDSTTGIDVVAPASNTKLSASTLTWDGTIGTTYKCEGYAGATWYGFNTGTHGKFYKTSNLNVPAYYVDYSITEPDYIYARLGINDVLQYNNSFNAAQSQILIDSLLAATTNVKIILGIPSIAENTGAGWMANYPTSSIAAMNEYIEDIHTYWQTIVNKYANQNYDARVDCSYEVLGLNRDDGYPKVGGIHSNGVHPSTLGYTQIGNGLSAYINRELYNDLSPDSLTATWVNDYDSLSWYDNTNNIAQHEIWASCQDSAYRLLATVAAGTDYYLFTGAHQNATYKFKIRGKATNWNSAYTSIITQNTPIVLKTNQSTPIEISFAALNTASQTINVNWGDGSNNDYSGSGARSHTYSVAKNPYYITITGALNDILSITVVYATHWSGDMSKLIIPSNILSLQLQGAFTGNISSWKLPDSMTGISLNSSNFSGDISGWNYQNLSTIQLAAGSTHLSGDLSGWTLKNTVTNFYASAQDFTGIPRMSNYKILTGAIGMYMLQNNCAQSEIDAFLLHVLTYFQSNTPIQNILLQLSGTGMAAPSATGLGYRTDIQTIFTTAGYTATITTN